MAHVCLRYWLRSWNVEAPAEWPCYRLWAGVDLLERCLDFVEQEVAGGFSIPRGSKYSIFKDSGPNNHTFGGIWNQSP